MRLSKLIGYILAGGCFALLGMGALFVLTPLSSIDPADSVENPPPIAQAQLAAADEAAPPAESVGIVVERPLFNDTRRPEVKTETGDTTTGPGDDPPPEETVPLDVSVNGVIIAPGLRLAIVTDNKTNTRMRVREGMPLEEEMATWTLKTIEPRKLTFLGNGQEELVEMEVDSKGAPAPARSQRPAEQAPQQAEEEQTADASAQTDRERQAEEIRRRVAERRAQLRAEAERRRAEQNKEQ